MTSPPPQRVSYVVIALHLPIYIPLFVLSFVIMLIITLMQPRQLARDLVELARRMPRLWRCPTCQARGLRKLGEAPYLGRRWLDIGVIRPVLIRHYRCRTCATEYSRICGETREPLVAIPAQATGATGALPSARVIARGDRGHAGSPDPAGANAPSDLSVHAARSARSPRSAPPVGRRA